jgi:hypothetical protein
MPRKLPSPPNDRIDWCFGYVFRPVAKEDPDRPLDSGQAMRALRSEQSTTGLCASTSHAKQDEGNIRLEHFRLQLYAFGMSPQSDASPPADKVLLNPPSPPLSRPPPGTISPDFDSRVDVYLGSPLTFVFLTGVKEGQYDFRGFQESSRLVNADCAYVKVRGPLRHQSSTYLPRWEFREEPL